MYILFIVKFYYFGFIGIEKEKFLNIVFKGLRYWGYNIIRK